jgi:PAS domain S-box-containing protein
MQPADYQPVPANDENRYRVLIDAITDYAIYMLDPKGVVTSWNIGAQRFKGYRTSEILGQNFARFYTDEDRAAGLPERALHTAATEGRFENEGWRVRKDGTHFWAHVIIDRISSADGELIGFAKITRDLTERRAAEQALRQSEEDFRLLVKSVTDYAIYRLDTTGRVTSWNLGAQRIKGYAPEEIIGEHFSKFYTDADREAGAPERGLTTAARDDRFETEGWRVRKDGSQFFAHVVIDAIRDDTGRLVGFAKITRDVTDTRRARLALEQAREALFQSQKMEAIGQLTGGVAHDFNNLLMAILGSLELAQKRMADDPAVNRLIDNAIQGARRGATLTQRMLAFARRQELNRESVDLPQLVLGMAELLERSLGHSVAIETHFPIGLPPGQTDPNQLESAILNLVVNARDAMPEGGTVSISARKAKVGGGEAGPLAPGAYICLSVTDTGEGMDEETVARAAEPFFTTKGVGKGTGLGLSMVHGLAEQSGGALRIASEPGQGTTMEIWLPVAAVQATAPEPEPEPPAEAAPSSHRLVVLAVDDDELVLLNTVAMLEEFGHGVLQASSGREALEVLERGECVDLLITDQAMPGMTGAQLAKRVRQRWPHLPIVLATGFAQLGPDEDPALPRLAKPFTMAELAKVVEQIVADEA